jgi:hypothetical protein
VIRFIRTLGYVMIVCGILSIITWLIKPLRQIWPWIAGPLKDWFLSLPLAIQVGAVAASGGFLLLVTSLIMERIEDRKSEKGLFDD